MKLLSNNKRISGRTIRGAVIRGSAFLLTLALTLSCAVFAPGSCILAQAESLTGDGHPYDPVDEAARQQEPVQSNAISNWPQGPIVSAGSAILMDVNTGTVLYAKNIHERMYPASTTKLLTCLIAAENLDLDDTVTFSENAVYSVPADGSNIGMDVGETITVEQCLYGILVGSANECANAIAEKVAGSIEAFAVLMNEKAASLGCTDSHFVNANGLFDEDHYTSAHDLCLIGKAFFQNETLINIGCTSRYHFTATATQPDDFWIINKHGLINGDYSYNGILGGKTGYTSQSKETLVTGCEQNGMRLVCVVMKEDYPKQFEDTISLFDYGYDNFTMVDAAGSDTRYQIVPAPFFSGGTDLIGVGTSALSIAEGSYVDVPSTVSFDDLYSSIAQDNVITYTLHEDAADSADNAVLGTATLLFNEAAFPDPAAGTKTPAASTSSASADQDQNIFRQILSRIQPYYYTQGLNGTIYINILTVLATILAIVILIILIVIIIKIVRSVTHSRRHQVRKRARRAAHSARKRQKKGSRSDDTIAYYRYDRPDHFNDDDDSWY